MFIAKPRIEVGQIPLVMDGAMGTELMRRGLDLPLPLWSAEANLTHPELVRSVHQDYVKAGADILTTNTFRTTTWTYKKEGFSPRRARERARESLLKSVEIIRQAGGVDLRIAGSMTTLEDCYQPDLFPGSGAAEDTYGETAEWFLETGISLFLFETMGHLTEITAAMEVTKNMNAERWLSLIMKDESSLLSGHKLEDALKLADSSQASLLMLNCNNFKITEKTISNLASEWDHAWGVYPNLGIDQPEPDGTIKDRVSIEIFQRSVRAYIESGASVVGACCGSTPEHIKIIRDTVDELFGKR